MTPPLYDLFGEIPVTLEEIEIWIDVVPGWPRTTSAARRANYAQNWNVPEKIRQAKRAGDWPRIEAVKIEQLAAVGITTSARR